MKIQNLFSLLLAGFYLLMFLACSDAHRFANRKALFSSHLAAFQDQIQTNGCTYTCGQWMELDQEYLNLKKTGQEKFAALFTRQEAADFRRWQRGYHSKKLECSLHAISRDVEELFLQLETALNGVVRE